MSRGNNPDTDGRLQRFVSLPFNPTQLITGNGYFVRADMGITGPGVTAWADQSSFGHNLGFLNANPSFSSTGFNSNKPGVTFTEGSNTDESVILSFNSTTVSSFILIQFTSSSGSIRIQSVEANGQNDATGANSFVVNCNGSSPGSSAFSCRSNGNVEQGNGGSTGGALAANGLYLLGMVFDGANVNKWFNGSLVGSGSAFTNTLGNGASCLLSIGNSNFPCCSFVCAFAGITQKVMSSGDWSNLKSWSNTNWGTSF